MQIVIDISEDDLDAIKFLKVKGWASRHELLILNSTPLDEVLDKIRAEIKRPLEIERYADTDSAKAQAIALNWCIEIIDRYIKDGE